MFVCRFTMLATGLLFFGTGVLADNLSPRVDRLIEQMTLKEKIGQLNLLTSGGGVATGATLSENVETKIAAGKVGGLFGGVDVKQVHEAQRIATTKSRLKIPLLIGSDVIHGYKTTYPIPLATASSWDLDLIESLAQMAAGEATADGINWNFSPMVDVTRDPRWGRISESAGEDPYLGSAIAAAMVRGYQGDDLTRPNTMLACVKHMALYGAPEGGRDYNSVDMSRVKMFNHYLPPYRAAVDAGVATVMTSFNDINGVPASANRWLLTDLLRRKWGFDGMVVSDYTSINEMTAHGLGDLQQVSALAINAGLDMDMVGEGFLTTLEKSVEQGIVSESQITAACRRILIAKDRLGLFEDPFRYGDLARRENEILSPANRSAARKAATAAAVLLKNHDGILPIDPAAKIALIGPLANDKNNMLGTWAPTGDVKLAVPILKGIREVIPDVSVQYAKGANISDDPQLAEKVNVFGPRIVIDKRSAQTMLDEALRIARQSDIVVAVVGEASEMSGEAASRSEISIPPSQKRLIRALVETGKPVALVLMSGRPLTIVEESEMPVAILQVWHPGIEAGRAVADLLIGNANPSGKLTATWPRNVGQIPIYHSMQITGRPAAGEAFEKFKSNYLDVSNRPLYPFGYGLSYTTFQYDDLKLDRQRIGPDQSVTITVELKNVGDKDGAEVAQLYLRDVVRSLAPPAKQLAGFRKVFLRAGESQTVQFVLSPDDLKFYNSDLRRIAEPGEFQVFVGGNSDASLSENFVLTKSPIRRDSKFPRPQK